MASFDYQVLGLRTLKIVNLPPHPLPQANIPLFIKVLILSLLQELTVQFVLEAPYAQVSSDSEGSTAFLRKD